MSQELSRSMVLSCAVIGGLVMGESFHYFLEGTAGVGAFLGVTLAAVGGELLSRNPEFLDKVARGVQRVRDVALNARLPFLA